MGTRLTTRQYERSIIDLIKAAPRTQQAVADELGVNYYTVRRIVKELTERGILRAEGMIDRAAIYCYIGNESDGDYIPYLTDIINRVSIKSVHLTESVGSENHMRSVLAAKHLPHYVVELLILAQQANTGAILGDKLDRTRDRMTRDMLYLKNAAAMYEQVLQEPRFWDAKTLKEMVNDPDYNYAIIAQAWEYINDSED